MRDKVTETAVGRIRTNAVDDKREIFLWDTELRGFGARASPKGNVSFVVQKYHGRMQRVVVGKWPWMKVEAARKEACIIIGDMFRAARSNTAFTVGVKLSADRLQETWERYSKERYTNDKKGKLIKRVFEAHVMTELGKNSFVRAITKADILRVIDAKRETAPVMARLMFAAAKPFFDYCVQRDIITVSPMATLTRPSQNSGRERFLSSDEIKRYWSAVSTFGYPYEHFYKIALLTGQRNITEVATMEWSEIEGDVWTIPNSKAKNGRAHVVHLSPLALRILQKVPKKSHLVFTSNGKNQIRNLGKYKPKLDKLMGTDDWVVHDLRRTMVTIMASELKIESNIADRILNHVAKDAAGVAGVYQKYQFLDERKQALLAYSEYIEKLTKAGQH